MSRWWGHLRLKVLAFGIAMSVLPLALYGWYGLVAARGAQVEIVRAQNLAAAQTVAEELAQFVRRIMVQVELLARVEGGDLVQAPRAEQQRVLYTLLRDVEYLEELTLVDSTGHEVVRASRREVLAGRTPAVYSGTPLWNELMAGRSAVGPVVVDPDGRPLFSVGVPLPDGRGALIARPTLRGLVANIATVQGAGPVRIHVVDGGGRLIGDSDFSLVLAGYRPAQPVEPDAPYRSVIGDQAFGALTPVPGLDWQVVGETAEDDAMRPVRRLAAEFGVGAAVLMAVVVALSIVFGLQLTVPLERLEAGANRVGAGDLGHRIAQGGRDELGRLVRAFNAMTERLQAQSRSLQAERDRLDTVVSAIGAGLALIDAEGRILWANQTLSRWFPEGLVGTFCWDGLGRSDCQGCNRSCSSDGVERSVNLGGQLRLIRYRTYQLTGTSTAGEPARLEVLEDVTDHRTMEAMVFQSEKLAAVGQLAAGVAHEINNPLAVISAYAEDLQDRLRDEGAVALDGSGELNGYLGQLQVQVQRCKGITMNLLDFARRGSTEPEPVDLLQVARQTADLVGPRGRKAGVQVLVDEADLAPVRATRDQLQQVFLNLITNAVDALEGGDGGRVTVGAERAGGMVRVRVADDGPGMDSETLARATEPFFTTKPPGRGTGLGLSMCYGIVTGLGGRFWLESAPGAGTAVWFELPVWMATGEG